jgi:hypothetical protein
MSSTKTEFARNLAAGVHLANGSIVVRVGVRRDRVNVYMAQGGRRVCKVWKLDRSVEVFA